MELDPIDIIGKRISVYWKKNKRWFSGVVSGLSEKRLEVGDATHLVLYDDRDVVNENLTGPGATRLRLLGDPSCPCPIGRCSASLPSDVLPTAIS